MTTTQTNRGEILEHLRALERQHGFRVLYACESGSRAWGFASEDSDYDVRFIYVHRPEWYLSMRQRSDTVSLFADETLDLAGWDLRKALGLFARSNGALLEWLHSSICYVEHPDLVPLWRTIVPDVLNPRALAAHYLGMAWKHWLVLREKESATMKKYLYILRTVSAARWVLSRKSVPPVEFVKLLNGAVEDDVIRSYCNAMTIEKASANESCSVPREVVVDQWLEIQFKTLRELNADLPSRPIDYDIIDAYFRHVLQDVWVYRLDG